MRKPVRLFTLATVAFLSSTALAGGFEVHSETLKSGHFDNAQVFNGFGCSGGNVSPQIKWSGAPAGTKSFAVTIYDPDAPTGSGWWHWVVVNLPASTSELPLGAGSEPGKLPAGTVQVKTDFGKPGYGGPCPPLGQKHRYRITVHALKVEKLDIGADAPAAQAGFMINANSLGKATLTATYGR